MPGRLPRRPYLGADLQQTAPLVVSGVHSDSPAERAGLVTGDTLQRLDGRAVRTTDELLSQLRAVAEKSSVTLEVLRAGREQTLLMQVEPMPLESVAGGRIELGALQADHGVHRTLLALPEVPGPLSAVLLIPGVSWRSCEFPLEPAAALFGLVQALCNAGVASMRVERGGMGDSTGIACTELDFAAELATYRSAAEALLADSRVATVSVFGHSYGGMVAPLLAELPVSRLAVVGTTALRWEQSVLSAARIVYEQSGLSAAQVKAKVRALTELGHCVYRNGMTPDEARSARPEAAGVVPEWYRGERLAGRKVQFYRQLNELDLGEAWRRVQRPVLALAGSDDFVCPPPQARRIAELCSGRARVIDGLGHELGDASGISGALSHALCSWFATS